MRAVRLTQTREAEWGKVCAARQRVPLGAPSSLHPGCQESSGKGGKEQKEAFPGSSRREPPQPLLRIHNLGPRGGSSPLPRVT